MSVGRPNGNSFCGGKGTYVYVIGPNYELAESRRRGNTFLSNKNLKSFKLSDDNPKAESWASTNFQKELDLRKKKVEQLLKDVINTTDETIAWYEGEAKAASSKGDAVKAGNYSYRVAEATRAKQNYKDKHKDTLRAALEEAFGVMEESTELQVPSKATLLLSQGAALEQKMGKASTKAQRDEAQDKEDAAEAALKEFDVPGLNSDPTSSDNLSKPMGALARVRSIFKADTTYIGVEFLETPLGTKADTDDLNHHLSGSVAGSVAGSDPVSAKQPKFWKQVRGVRKEELDKKKNKGKKPSKQVEKLLSNAGEVPGAPPPFKDFFKAQLNTQWKLSTASQTAAGPSKEELLRKKMKKLTKKLKSVEEKKSWAIEWDTGRELKWAEQSDSGHGLIVKAKHVIRVVRPEIIRTVLYGAPAPRFGHKL